MRRKVYVKGGERHLLVLPYSEVCIHMRVAGHFMFAELLLSEDSAMVQLWRVGDDEEGKPYPKDKFSFPITTGEAGVYQDEDGYYIYQDEVVR